MKRHARRHTLFALAALCCAIGLAGCDEPAERPDPFSLGYTGEQVDRAVARGAELYVRNACNTCHSVDGVDGVAGPSWKGIYGQEVKLSDGTTRLRDYRYLRQSITDPHSQIVLNYGASMSSYPRLTPEDIDALLWYIWSLRDIETDTGTAPPSRGDPAQTAAATSEAPA
ncbi:MAG: cytochrome c [Planctomycetota bacterium]